MEHRNQPWSQTRVEVRERGNTGAKTMGRGREVLKTVTVEEMALPGFSGPMGGC